MNRYDVTNQRNGNSFSIQSTAFPPISGYQPEWGKRARTVLKDECDAFELPRATNERPHPDNPEKLIVDLPDDFVVVTTDITQALADEDAKRTAQETRLDQLKNLQPTDITDLATARNAIILLARAVRRLAKND